MLSSADASLPARALYKSFARASIVFMVLEPRYPLAPGKQRPDRVGLEKEPHFFRFVAHNFKAVMLISVLSSASVAAFLDTTPPQERVFHLSAGMIPAETQKSCRALMSYPSQSAGRVE